IKFDENNKEYKIYIEVSEEDNLRYRLPLKNNRQDSVNRKDMYITNNSSIYRLVFKKEAVSNDLSLIFVKQSIQVEINKIFIRPDKALLEGCIINNAERFAEGKYGVIIKKREGNEIIQDEIEIKNNKFKYLLDLDSLVANNNL